MADAFGRSRLRVGVAVLGATVTVAGCGKQEGGGQDGAMPPPADPPANQASPPPSATTADPTAERRHERRQARSKRTPSGTLLSTADMRSFTQLEQHLGGDVGLVVGPLGMSGGRQSLGRLRSGAAWSTIKLPIVVRVLEDAGGSNALPAADRRLIRRALTASDNAAAADLWRGLTATYGGAAGAASALEEVLDRTGDQRTSVSTEGHDGFSPYGQTTWPLAAQERFMAALAGGCATDPIIAGDALALMAEVVAGQRWGLGSAGRPARFKGGWGPGTDGRYLVRQVGVLEYGGGARAVAVALAARSTDGTFAGGTRAVTALARWAAQHVDPDAVRPATC